MNQVRFKISYKIFADQFYEIEYIFSNRTLDRDEILQWNIKHIKIYCGKFSGQMKFGNIIVQGVKCGRWILLNMSN
jgi:hypothetical protein